MTVTVMIVIAVTVTVTITVGRGLSLGKRLDGRGEIEDLGIDVVESDRIKYQLLLHAHHLH